MWLLTFKPNNSLYFYPPPLNIFKIYRWESFTAPSLTFAFYLVINLSFHQEGKNVFDWWKTISSPTISSQVTGFRATCFVISSCSSEISHYLTHFSQELWTQNLDSPLDGRAALLLGNQAPVNFITANRNTETWKLLHKLFCKNVNIWHLR